MTDNQNSSRPNTPSKRREQRRRADPPHIAAALLMASAPLAPHVRARWASLGAAPEHATSPAPALSRSWSPPASRRAAARSAKAAADVDKFKALIAELEKAKNTESKVAEALLAIAAGGN